MDEIKITCLCSRVQIQDLGLELTRGQVLYVEAAKAELSNDLTTVWRAGGVAKRPVRRFAERRQQQVVRPVRTQTSSRRVRQPMAPVQAAAKPSRIDLEDLAQRVADKLAPVLLRAVGEKQINRPADAQVFTPSGIVQAGSDSSEATETGATSVKEAVAALKKTKRKTRTKKRKAKTKAEK